MEIVGMAVSQPAENPQAPDVRQGRHWTTSCPAPSAAPKTRLATRL